MSLRVVSAATGEERQPTAEEIAAWEVYRQTMASPSPNDQPLTKRQINRALILAGHSDPDAFIETAIATIEDDTQRALALTDWRLAPFYDRDHPLLNDPAILTAAGFTPKDVDDLWVVATQQPA